MTDQTEQTRSAGKVILFVSGACNLRCRYCYLDTPASGGKMLMTEETARAIARKIFSNHGTCTFVQFFGGEPTLNMPAIRAFLDEIGRMIGEGFLLRPPGFGMVTNGATGRSEALASLCLEHDIGVTVSLDGIKHIHDALRPGVRGLGSFDRAVGTVESLLRAGARVAVETVYTSLHIDEQCSIVDVLEFTQALGVSKSVLHTVYPPAPPALSPFDDAHIDALRKFHVDAVDWWFESLLTGCRPVIDVYFKDLFLPLLQGGGAAVAGGGCPAGNREFAIAPNGDVYSCHLLYGMRRFYLGNILEDERLEKEVGLPLTTFDLKECSECFARHWCQPCGALNLSWGDAWIPSERECALRRAVVLRIGEWAFEYLLIPENPVTDTLRRVAAARPPAAIDSESVLSCD